MASGRVPKTNITFFIIICFFFDYTRLPSGPEEVGAELVDCFQVFHNLLSSYCRFHSVLHYCIRKPKRFHRKNLCMAN